MPPDTAPMSVPSTKPPAAGDGAHLLAGLSHEVIARFDAPLFFANGDVFDSYIRELVENAPTPVRWVIVAAEPITGVDTTALGELIELDDHLARHGISLVFAEMKGPVKDRLVRFGMRSRFGPDHFFPTVNGAVKAYRREMGHRDGRGQL